MIPNEKVMLAGRILNLVMEIETLALRQIHALAPNQTVQSRQLEDAFLSEFLSHLPTEELKEMSEMRVSLLVAYSELLPSRSFNLDATIIDGEEQALFRNFSSRLRETYKETVAIADRIRRES